MTGKITIQKTKKSFVAGIEGTKLQLTEFRVEESDAGKECEYEAEKGRLATLHIAGENRSKVKIPPPAQQHGKNAAYGQAPRGGGFRPQTGYVGGGGNTGQKSHQTEATAPYNFIPLNDKVIAPPEPFPGFDKFTEGRHTGHIDLEIVTKTPLFIRGMTQDPKTKTSEFFAAGGVPAIPGSSLRGMVRQFFEIATWGKFIGFSNSRYYFRAFAEVGYATVLNDVYKERTNDTQAGYLVYHDQYRTYSLRPAKEEHSATFVPVKDTSKKDCIEKRGNNYLIYSGFMQKKGNNWLINPPDPGAELIPLAEEDIHEYRSDSARKAKINLLKELQDSRKYPGGVPCFYSSYTDETGQKRHAFGHTRFFRVPYTNAVGARVPKGLQGDAPDIAETVFGKLGSWAGRVSFEDAPLVSDLKVAFHPETVLKVLSTPRPTTVQHYLEQPHSSKLTHWDTDDGKISGYKSYWHKDGATDHSLWEEAKARLSKGELSAFFTKSGMDFERFASYFDNDQKNWEVIYLAGPFRTLPEGEFKETMKRYLLSGDKVQNPLVRPVNEGSRFTGRIRFDNLSEIELGALLFVLNLPAGCGHKLGMGKPLGMGSVEITPKLVLSHRNERYASLFDESGWNLAEHPAATEEYVKTFEAFMASSGALPKNCDGLWNAPRMKMFRTMLSFPKGKGATWNEKREYMPLAGFKKRPLLPTPTEMAT